MRSENESFEDDELGGGVIDSVHGDANDDLERERLKSDRQDRKQRKMYTSRVWSFIEVYFVIIFFIVCFSQLIRLSDAVLMVILGTTTTNILGLAYIVMRYLFHHK